MENRARKLLGRSKVQVCAIKKGERGERGNRHLVKGWYGMWTTTNY